MYTLQLSLKSVHCICMLGPHCQCTKLYLDNSFQVHRIADMFMNEDTVFQTIAQKIFAVEFHMSFVLPSGYHYWR